VEVICDDQNVCGEGPLWDATRGRIIWNDCGSSILFEFQKGGKRRVISRGLMISAAAMNRDGRLIVAGAAGLHLWAAQDDFLTLHQTFDGQPLAFNDIIATPAGGIYGGTLYGDATGIRRRGALYHMAPGGGIKILDGGFEIANGLAFSPDDRTLYFADSAARVIYAYDVHAPDGSLHRRRVFARVAADDGIPDGLTVDSQGFVYSAQWYGGCIIRFDPEGIIESRIHLPVSQISSVAFGGNDLCDLYVTTALAPSPSPLAPRRYDATKNTGGALYRVRSDVPGRREHVASFTL
jgi:D-xylonolactonase